MTSRMAKRVVAATVVIVAVLVAMPLSRGYRRRALIRQMADARIIALAWRLYEQDNQSLAASIEDLKPYGAGRIKLEDYELIHTNASSRSLEQSDTTKTPIVRARKMLWGYRVTAYGDGRSEAVRQ
jgi:hypothetical protein